MKKRRLTALTFLTSPIAPLILLTLSLILLELLSFFNAQLLGIAPAVPWPHDVFIDLKNKAYTETFISLGVSLSLMALGLAYYVGGLARVIAYVFLCLIAGVLFALILTTLTFNAWSGAHIKTVRDFLDVIAHLTHHTRIYNKFWFSALFGCALPVILLANWLHEKVRSDNKVLGNAHFANGWDIQKGKFFKQENESIIIGKKYGVPLYSNGFEHVLVFAPSGSGKTRSIAVPNLLNYPSSLVCNDVKFSLFETTSGYRERVLGHTCYCWAPSHPQGITHRFNPLDIISNDPLQRMTDIQRIAHILMPDGKDNPFWAQSSRKIFKALMLYLLDTPERPTSLGEINRLSKQQDFDSWLQHLLENTTHYDPEFYRNGFSYIGVHFETRSSILASFSGYFELFDDPIIDAATSASDFDLRDLRRKKMTIYVGFTEEDMERLSPILTLFWQQLISCMIKEIPDKKTEPHPVLCLIDEFSSLGRIEYLRRSLKLLREYRVRCILMFQYIAQTHERYSQAEAQAFTNIKTKIAYTSEDLNDAEWISKMLGTRTKRIVSASVSHQYGSGINDSKSISYQAIPLLRPEEVMKLKSHVALIVRSGSSPMKSYQYIWYKEACMKNRPKAPSLIPTQTITQAPFTHAVRPVKEKKTVKANNRPPVKKSETVWCEDVTDA